MRKLRSKKILALVHSSLLPPDSIEGLTEDEIHPWKMEYDVIATLINSGHELIPVGVSDDLGVLRQALEDSKPDIVFNMLEEFNGQGVFDQHVVSYLELMRQPYTGCNPRGLMLSHDKALSKKVLTYHRIRVPRFAFFPIGGRVERPRPLRFPVLVKSATAEGSLGISQASLVHDDERLRERVDFVHRNVRSAAIAEEFIDGRELYVAITGNRRLTVYPIWELLMTKLSEGAPFIATSRAKWNYEYQEKVGLKTGPAKLSEKERQLIERIAKRIYRLLGLTGYARLDFRYTTDGQLYLLEANPNPNLSFGEDFAEAAERGGLKYPALLERIVTLGLRYQPYSE